MAWLAAAAAFAEPLTQQQVAMAAAGGPRRALRGRVLALAGVGAVLALVDVAFPALFGLFDRTPALADLAAAALAHVACAALGVGLGLLAVPPAARRPHAAFMVIVAYAVLAVPLYDLAPVLSPVAWLAATLTDAAPRTLAPPSSSARSPPSSRRRWRCAGEALRRARLALAARARDVPAGSREARGAPCGAWRRAPRCGRGLAPGPGPTAAASSDGARERSRAA